MTCHYRLRGDEDWLRGCVYTYRGGRCVYLTDLDGKEDLELYDAEVQIDDHGLRITGYVADQRPAAGGQTYRLMTVEIRANKPRVKK